MERKSAKWGCMHKTNDQLRCLDLPGICAENKRGREKSICVHVFLCVGQIVRTIIYYSIVRKTLQERPIYVQNVKILMKKKIKYYENFKTKHLSKQSAC